MKKLSICFISTMLILIMVFLLFLIYPPSIDCVAHQKSVFFMEGKDLFADFFNPLRYNSEGSFYFSKVNEFDGHGGFPLGAFIIMPFLHFADYSKMSFHDCIHSPTSMFCCYFYMTCILYLFWDSFNRLRRKYRMSSVLVVVLMFSSIYLFAVERANVVLMVAAFVNYFLLYYDSNKKWLRYFAIICICLATVYKGYPVLFGLLLLRDKRYKDIAICTILTLLLAFVPFLFMDRGLDNIPKMFANTALNSKAYFYHWQWAYGPHKIAAAFCSINRIAEPFTYYYLTYNTRLIFMFLSLMTFVYILMQKMRWKELMMISCVIILYPINSNLYTGLYLFPAILLFLTEKRSIGFLDWVVMFLLCMALCPFQIVMRGFSVTALINNCAIIGIWALLLGEAVIKMKVHDYLDLYNRYAFWKDKKTN